MSEISEADAETLDIESGSVSNDPVSRFSITLLQSKSKPSFAWRHFGFLMYKAPNDGGDDGGGGLRRISDDKVFCSACLESAVEQNPDQAITECHIQYYGDSVATSNLVRHLKNVHGITEENKDEKRLAIELRRLQKNTVKRPRGRPRKSLLTGSIRMSRKLDSSKNGSSDESGLQDNSDAIIFLQDTSHQYASNDYSNDMITDSNSHQRVLPDQSSSSIKNKLNSIQKCLLELDQEHQVNVLSLKRKMEREEELHSVKVAREKEGILQQREEHRAQMLLIKLQTEFWEQKLNSDSANASDDG